jgi:hypothetical protein
MKSVDQQMQDILPGSTTFAARLLCPKCGWHFKAGLTDPSGKHVELMPDAALVCGQCLAILHIDAQRKPQVMSREQLAAADPECLEQIKRHWMLAYMALQLTGPDPDAGKKGQPQ